MIKNSKYILILCIFLVSSCTRNNKLTIDDFTIPISIKNTSSKSKYSKKSSVFIFNPKLEKNPIIFKHSYEKKLNKFSEVDLEIFYPLFLFENYNIKRAFCLIGIKKYIVSDAHQSVTSGDEAFVIFWANNEYKLKGTIWTNSRYWFTNEIDETTYKLYTTLEEEDIKTKFPKFNGTYNKIEVDSIVIDYNYCISDYEFFNKIKINDFKLGYTWFK